jgi:hypothetical protein
MARTTKQLSGGGKDKFLRAVVAEVELPADAAKRLGDRLAHTVTEVRVRRDAWEALSKSQMPAPAVAPPPPQTVDPGVGFDPFAFSAVAVFTKKGKPALAAELARIATADHLKAFAAAQHLAVDATLAAPADLRAAIVAAVERRIADRKAAAS